MTQPLYDDMLGQLQGDAFSYFVNEVNPANGLVKDCTRPDFPSSIAAVGLALAAYPVGVERGLLTRTEAAARVLTTLRFFWTSPQGPEPDATGYKGFYYHFLHMETGRRAWDCELSTIDTALLLAGALTAALYFDWDVAEEREVRELADALYRRTDWQWAQNGEATVTHGWRPEGGFLPYRWRGYDEATILYLLGLGSPTHPLSVESYIAYTSTYSWKKIYDYEFCTRDRSSSTNTRTSGSTFAGSRMSTCAPGASTTSRTAGGRPTCSRNTRSATRSSSGALVGAITANAAGVSPPATARAPKRESLTVSNATFLIT